MKMSFSQIIFCTCFYNLSAALSKYCKKINVTDSIITVLKIAISTITTGLQLMKFPTRILSNDILHYWVLLLMRLDWFARIDSKNNNLFGLFLVLFLHHPHTCTFYIDEVLDGIGVIQELTWYPTIYNGLQICSYTIEYTCGLISINVPLLEFQYLWPLQHHFIGVRLV